MSSIQLTNISNASTKNSISALLDGRKLSSQQISDIKNEYFNNAYFKVKLNLYIQKSLNDASVPSLENVQENKMVSLREIIKN